MTHRILLTAALALLAGGELLAQTFTVTGTWEYEDKAWGYNGWTGSDPMFPIRRADVRVIDDLTQVTLGSGSTDQNGDFSIECTSAGVTDIVVRVDADTGLDGDFQRIRVTTEQNVEYSAFSPVFAGHDTSTDLDVGLNSALKITQGNREANPFNMLDMGVHSAEYILGAAADTASGSTIRLYWPSGSGSFASGNGAHMADDDGYDDAVILHEIGHVVHNLYSDSDSPGGTHFFGDSDQDPRLSLGEGYATFFAGMIMVEQIGRQAVYMDANGASQNGGAQLRLRLENVAPYNGDSYGAADEVAVACVLYDMLDDESHIDPNTPGTDDDDFTSADSFNGLDLDQAFWTVFEGPIASAANLTLNDVWDGWFAEFGADGNHPDLESVFDKRRVRFSEDVDEPNDTLGGDMPTIVPSTIWSGERTLYASDQDPPVPGLGDRDWWMAELVVGSRVTFETRYPNGVGDADTQCDTEIRIFDPDSSLVIVDESSGVGRNAKVEDLLIDQTGPWRFRVRSSHPYREYGRYNYRLSYTFENELPQITNGPTATPETITDSETSTLSVTATDAQALTYTWTPVDGGSVVGSGSSVTFMPPVVASTTDFDIELVVSDSFGAAAETQVVTVTVSGAGSPCGNPASATSGGSGKPGQLGTPVLAGLNQPTVPNADFALEMTGALPSAPCFIILGLSLASAPFDFGTMYPSPDLILPATTTPAGEVLLPLPLPADAGLCGGTLYWQIMVPDDPGAIGARQTSQTNYVETVFGS